MSSFDGLPNPDGLYRYVPLSRVWFSSSLLWDRVYKSESLGLESGIIFQETDQLVEDISLDSGNRELLLKNIKNQIGKFTVSQVTQLRLKATIG